MRHYQDENKNAAGNLFKFILHMALMLAKDTQSLIKHIHHYIQSLFSPASLPIFVNRFTLPRICPHIKEYGKMEYATREV